MMQLTYGHEPRLLPKSLHDRIGEPKPLLPRVTHAQDEHEMNWIEAIQRKAAISCPFEYAAPLTEVMLLGIVSLRAGQKTPGTARSTTTAPACASPIRSRAREGPCRIRTSSSGASTAGHGR
jgi:hypothetical protein